MPDLTSLLEHAIAYVPIYKKLAPVLDEFPILDKISVLQDLPSYLSDELGEVKLKLVNFLQDESRSFGQIQEYAFGARIIVEETSGSSGIPFRSIKTLEERSRLLFAIWRYRKQIDALCTPKSFYAIMHRPAHIETLGNARNFTQAGIDDFYTKLTKAGIRWIHCDARVLRLHSEVISNKVASNMSVKFAENTGMRLSEEDQQFIETRLRVKLIDQYGCRELWAIGARYGEKHFTVITDNVFVELIDDLGNTISDAGKQGRIVVTGLHQKIFPIIRYDTGDFGCWADKSTSRCLLLSSCRQHNLYNSHGRELDGNALFRKMVSYTYIKIGYVPVNYIQIRQIGKQKFVLAVNQCKRAIDLCQGLQDICRVRPWFTREVKFELLELSDAEVTAALEKKPALFTTCYWHKDELLTNATPMPDSQH